MTDLTVAPNVAWHDTLAAGDIVSFRFPYPDAPYAERARPCLVVDVDPIAGEAVVVYGTSRWTKANQGQELHVTGSDAGQASLDRPTRFVGARRVRVSIGSPRFIAGGRGTPVVGRLTGKARDHLDRLKHAPLTPGRRGKGLRRACSRQDEPAGAAEASFG
ncbi:MAG: hypothetical protein HUJ24_09660 [Rhodobacteraceae bacterium]|nr:hypothetical protein [Paracoccaceae bacterium]